MLNRILIYKHAPKITAIIVVGYLVISPVLANHETYMRRCLELAKPGLRDAMPNPSVGAVAVYNGQIVGEGSTSAYGGSHAEVNAINAIKNREILKASTLYVSLEPCSHHGKTPPCTDLIIKSGIQKVVIGCNDPFPEVNGRGIRTLRDRGIEVITGILEAECLRLNRRFFTFHAKQRPYIILKWAQSTDGYLDAPRDTNELGIKWITQPETKELTHSWRSREMAIAIGTNTAVVDNPSLTVRAVQGKNPARIVLDRTGRLNPALNVFNSDATTLVLTELTTYPVAGISRRIDFTGFVSEFNRILYEENLLSVIVEGGAKLLQTFIQSNNWDEARILTGSTNFGGGIKAPTLTTKPVHTKTFGKDRIDFVYNV